MSSIIPHLTAAAVSALAVMSLLLALPAHAADAPGSAADLHAPPGASSCSGCHGAGPVWSAQARIPPVAGRPAADIAAAMAEYRAGTRDATVMGRIAKGFTEDETRAIAAWLERAR